MYDYNLLMMITLILLSYYIQDVKLIKKGVFKWTSKSFIEREMLMDLPTNLDTSDFRKIESRIRNIGLYFDVKVYPEDSLSDSTNLVVEIIEGWYILPNLSLNYSDEKGWTFGTGFVTTNLFGRNYYFTFMYIGGGETNYFMSFGKRWSKGTPVNYSLSLGKMKMYKKIEQFNKEDTYISGEIGFKIKKFITLTLNPEYHDVTADTSGKTINSNNEDIYIKTGINIGVDTKDDLILPTKGIKLYTRLNHYHGLHPYFLIEEAEFSFSFYKKIVGNNILAANTSYHGFFGDEIPTYMKLYIGGGRSVRGWDFGSLRGNHTINLRTEYRSPIVSLKRRKFLFLKDALCGIFFYTYYDFGMIGENTIYDFVDFKYIDSPGFGINFIIPYIGGIRIEAQRKESKWKPGINLGWAF